MKRAVSASANSPPKKTIDKFGEGLLTLRLENRDAF